MRSFVLEPELVVRRSQGRNKVHEEGRCRMCLRPGVWGKRVHARAPGERVLTRHHLVPQDWFACQLRLLKGSAWMRVWELRDVDANIVPLCETCHRLVEKDVEARQELRKVLAPIEATFAIRVRGQDWFDLRYPPSAATLLRDRPVLASEYASY